MQKKIIYGSIFSLAWALDIFFTKIILKSGINALDLALQVLIISSIIITLISYKKLKTVVKSKGKTFFSLLSIGLIVGVGYVTGNLALRLTSSINYSFLVKSSIFFTVFLALIFLKEKLSKMKLLIMGTLVLGVFLLTTSGKLIIPKVGDLLTLLTSFLFSVALVIQKPITKKIEPQLIGWARITYAIIPVLIGSLILRIKVFETFHPLVIPIGIISSVIAIYINKTVKESSASFTVLYSMIVPLLVSILGILFLKETINLIQAVGGLLIILSGYLIYKKDI
jgi:drug/metabolite transporter (DMT)-like permease